MQGKDPLVCSVDKRGQSFYQFRSAVSSTQKGDVCLSNLATKGVGTVATSTICKGLKVFSERSVVSCVIGENENYICKYCVIKVQKKVKVRADCKCLTYCSDYCLQAACDFLDLCGPIIAKLHLVQDPTWRDIIQLLKLAVNYVYALLSATTATELVTLRRVLELESHPDKQSPTLYEAAQWLANCIISIFPESIISVLADRGLGIHPGGDGSTNGTRTTNEPLHTLLRVIKYNAQPLPVHGMQKVQLLTLLPTMARLNHGCVPNCALVYEIEQLRHCQVSGTTTGSSDNSSEESALLQLRSEPVRYRLSVSLLTLREVAAGEELVMSYLQPLCAAVDLRQSLLQQAFQFNCNCERCSADFKRISTSQIAPAAQKLKAMLQQLPSPGANNFGGGSLPVAQLRELLQTAEQISNTTSTTSSSDVFSLTLSTVHDSASYVLQQASARVKYLSTITNQSSAVQQQVELLTLAVRSSVTMSYCWGSAGCGSVLSRLELVISGSNSAVQLRKISNSGGVQAPCIKDLKRQLEDVVAILRSTYGMGGGSSDNVTETPTAETKGMYEVTRVPRDFSSDAYLNMLYSKAVPNLSALD